MRHKPPLQKHRRGFILIETMIGLAVALAAIAVAGSAMSQYRSGVRQMVALQNLKAQASAALLTLRAGQTPIADSPDITLQIVSRHPAAGTPGHVWVQVRTSQAEHPGQACPSATLWGLVPEAGIPPSLQKGQ